MKFIENVEPKKYDQFVEHHPKSHFLQSYVWGQFSMKARNLVPYYVGLEDDHGELIATALLLKKELPFHYCYLYSPRGFVLDYNDDAILEQFTEEIKKFAKKMKAIFVKIDPDLIYHEETNDGSEVQPNDDAMIEKIKKLGFHHLGFTKNFETMQPRYTFRINLEQPWEVIQDHFSKTTKQRIKKAEDFLVEVQIGNENDLPTFYQLMVLTEARKDFISHDEAYYRTLYEMWNQKHSCKIFLGSINLDQLIQKQSTTIQQIEDELQPLQKEELSKSEKTKKNELEKRKNKLESDLVRYQELKKHYPNKLTLSAHFILEYGDKAWVLYAGNHNELSETYANYKTYQEHIHHYHEQAIKTYDQFGTIGDLREDNPLLGLHEFKKKFGGNYVEFTGEFDYILNRPLYFLFTKLVPFYRKIINKIAKRNLKNN